MREKLRRKLDVKQNVGCPKNVECTATQKHAQKSNETGSPARISPGDIKTNSLDSAKKSNHSLLSSTKTSNLSTDNAKREDTNEGKKKGKDSKLSNVRGNQKEKMVEKENVDMSKLPIDKLAAYIEGTDQEAGKPKKAKKYKKKSKQKVRF